MAKRIFAGLCAVLCLASLALWRLDLGSALPRAAAQVAPSEVPVTAGVVTAQDVPQYLQGIGTVQAFNTVTVKTQVDGAIVKVAFTEGQEVRQGDLLFQIDPRPYEAALAQAMAAREKDAAQLVTAQADLVRYGRLVGPGFQTRQSYEQQQGLVAQLQAAIKGDEAQIDTARVNLGYTNISAPIDGRLGARLVDSGNLVRATDNTPLVSITQIKPIFVSFTLPQDDLDQIRQQQQKAPLAVTALASDGETVLGAGKLTLIDNMIDQATGTIHLKASFANQDERLWPGEFVNLRVVLRVQHDVATVPSQTVQDGPDGHFAYVISQNDTVERRPVEIAAVQNGLAVVTRGLAPGEHVVVEGQYRLTNGARVRLLPPKAAGAAS
ncbi:MAG: efflux RND transporter periplasmic adaptor subunit [Acetobacteraceae bacterium]|jgi:multidrug efflux system membrane fusion protein